MCIRDSNGHDLNTLFAQRSNLLSPAFWGMLRDILRFNRQSLDDLANNRISADTTLGQYLERNGYGRRFIEHYIVPMGSAIWSMSLADMLGFPLQFFVRFCKNHGLLSVSDRPTWQAVSYTHLDVYKRQQRRQRHLADALLGQALQGRLDGRLAIAHGQLHRAVPPVRLHRLLQTAAEHH